MNCWRARILFNGAAPPKRETAAIIPARPANLSRRQWNTLGRGLSWHRAGRSMHVRDWLRGLKAGAQESPSLADLQSSAETARCAQVPCFRASVAATLLLITGAAWLLFVRLAPGGKVIGEALRAPAIIASTAGSPSAPMAALRTQADAVPPKAGGMTWPLWACRSLHARASPRYAFAGPAERAAARRLFGGPKGPPPNPGSTT